MRLDEWQKYIDSQFLDDTPTPSAPASLAAQPGGAPSASKKIAQSSLPLEVPVASTDSVFPDAATIPEINVAPAPSAALASSKETSQTNQQSSAAESNTVMPPAQAPVASVSARQMDEYFPEPALSITHSVFTLVVAPPAPAAAPSGRPPRIEVLTPLPDAPSDSLPRQAEVVNKTRRRRQTRDAQQENTLDPAALSLPSSALPVSTPASEELFLPLDDLGADIPEFARYLPSSHAAASFPDVQTPVSLASTSAAQTNPTPAADVTPAPRSPSEPVRRAPRSRARHTRGLPPAIAPSAQSTAESWANVPRLMQTLLSLERIEEENEVAQFSYKRPFQEKRHELIERLLDPILSLEDTARLLNVCPTTVRRYTNRGILTYYRKEVQRGGKNAEAESGVEKETRQRRFRLSDILAFLEAQQPALNADRHAERRQRARAMQSPNANLDVSRQSAGDSADAYSHAEMETKSTTGTQRADVAKDV